MDLTWPSLDALPSYVDALQRGWSPDNVRLEAVTREHLAWIERDPRDFVAHLVDREAKGPAVRLPDGSLVPRLPGFVRWLWDGEFCGVINFRWQRGTSALPPYCLGHVGYSVVPWKQRRGYATQALRLLLPEARAEGLEYIDITADPDNVASHKVITANGGYLFEQFNKGPEYGGGEHLRFRIPLAEQR
jgi:predicted acetyltransferase